MTPPVDDLGRDTLVAHTDVAGTELLAETLRRAVARGQAATDTRQMRRLAVLARTRADDPPGAFALPPITTVRRYRIAEVTVAFDAVVRRDPSVDGGFAFVAAAPVRRSSAKRSSAKRSWARRILDALRRRRFAPVTITISADAARGAGRDATATGMER